jgi:hypothetical protein
MAEAAVDQVLPDIYWKPFPFSIAIKSKTEIFQQLLAQVNYQFVRIPYFRACLHSALQKARVGGATPGGSGRPQGLGKDRIVRAEAKETLCDDLDEKFSNTITGKSV